MREKGADPFYTSLLGEETMSRRYQTTLDTFYRLQVLDSICSIAAPGSDQDALVPIKVQRSLTWHGLPRFSELPPVPVAQPIHLP